MQQNSDTPSSSISRIPNEILLVIFVHTMRSDVPVHLEHFLRLGRQFQKIRNGNDTESSVTESYKVENRLLESGASASSESWFLNQLDSAHTEHFRDWLLINSSCRRFRTWGKKVFFSEKVFIFTSPFLRTLCAGTTKTIGAENVRTAQACIRHVIVPLSYGGTAGQFITLPRYHFLQSLRSLRIQTGCYCDRDILSMFKVPPLKRYPLPEELLTLLRGIGLQVNQLRIDIQHRNEFMRVRELQLDLQLDNEHQSQVELLADQVYSYLRTLAALKRK